MVDARIAAARDSARQVCDLDPAELEDLAWVLARAFRDNPLNLAVMGGSPARRVRTNRQGMRTTLSSALGRGLVVAVRSDSGTVTGGLVGLPPTRWPLPPPPLRVQVRTLLGQGLRVARSWGQVFQALSVVHPMTSHWYLAVVGVEPGAQGEGVGSGLVRHFVERVDADEESAYLETDRAENVAFYESFGFSVASELEILDVPVWRMWRDPASRL
jgi:ribosomal protein S18 acetylase RimI-like enzyme